MDTTTSFIDDLVALFPVMILSTQIIMVSMTASIKMFKWINTMLFINLIRKYNSVQHIKSSKTENKFDHFKFEFYA